MENQARYYRFYYNNCTSIILYSFADLSACNIQSVPAAWPANVNTFTLVCMYVNRGRGVSNKMGISYRFLRGLQPGIQGQSPLIYPLETTDPLFQESLTIFHTVANPSTEVSQL